MRCTKPSLASRSLIASSSSEMRIDCPVASICVSSAEACSRASRDCAAIRAPCSSSAWRRAANTAARARRARRCRRRRPVRAAARIAARIGLRRGAGFAHAGGEQLVVQLRQLGLAAQVGDHQERLARLHALTVAHQDFAHDAAFLVLHGLAVQLDLRGGRRHHRAGQWRRGHPAGEQRAHGQQRPQHQLREAAESAPLIGIGPALAQGVGQRGQAEGRRRSAHRGAPCSSVVRRWRRQPAAWHRSAAGRPARAAPPPRSALP